jgi:hypothetical protein
MKMNAKWENVCSLLTLVPVINAFNDNDDMYDFPSSTDTNFTETSYIINLKYIYWSHFSIIVHLEMQSSKYSCF